MFWRVRRWFWDWVHDLRHAGGDYVSAATLKQVARHVEDWRRVVGE